MAEAAALELPYPETAVVEEESLDEQTAKLAAVLPERPSFWAGAAARTSAPSPAWRRVEDGLP